MPKEGAEGRKGKREREETETTNQNLKPNSTNSKLQHEITDMLKADETAGLFFHALVGLKLRSFASHLKTETGVSSISPKIQFPSSRSKLDR